jgi:hypothetical protein
LKYLGWQPFCEDISELGAGRHVKNLGLTEHHTITHEMQINLHVLRPLMLNWVRGKIHSTEIVTIHNGSPRGWMMELLQELAKPTRLSDAVRNRTIFSLRTRA